MYSPVLIVFDFFVFHSAHQPTGRIKDFVSYFKSTRAFTVAMPFELAEIQVTDLPELAKLANKVWQAKSWELERHLYPVFDTEIMYPYRLKRITQGFQGDFKKHFKIVDTSNGRIVSYAAWEIPHPPQSEEASSQGGVPNNSPELSLPAGSNVQLFKDFYEELKRCKAKYSDQSRDYCE